MQNQMDAKLASIKSPGLKSGMPTSPSPSTRNFNAGNRQSLALDNSSNFLSPDSAANLNVPNDTPAAMLAQQRAKLKASNANHRISAPVLNSTGADIRASWSAASPLGQVSEQQQQLDTSQAQEVTVSRPKSTEFSGSLVNARTELAVPATDSWASMVSTPHTPMFGKKETRPIVNEPISRNDWSVASAPGVPRMGDPTIHRRNPKPQQGDNVNTDGLHNNVYDDNGNPIGPQQNQGRNNLRNVSGSGWSNAGGRNQGVNNNNNSIPNRFGGNDDGGPANSNANSNANAAINGLAMQMNGFGLGSPTLGMGMPGLGMAPMSPFNMLSMMNMSPEAQLLAAQMAASGFGQANWLGMQPLQSPGMLGNVGGQRRGGSGGARSPALKSASSSRADGQSTPRGDEDVDPALLNDIPAWLRSLRLHKYTPNFEGAKWQDMVMMDEAALEAKGVSALGARRKMLKTFETVRKKMGIDGGPPSSVPPSSATPKSP
jgi:hypothetical protein